MHSLAIIVILLKITNYSLLIGYHSNYIWDNSITLINWYERLFICYNCIKDYKWVMITLKSIDLS